MNQLIFICLLACAALAAPARAAVKLERVPHDGIQPQVLVDSTGAAHLLYFKGDPKAGDLFYTRRAAGQSAWKYPMRVNGEGKAMAVGNIRGAHLALGKGGRVYVAWMGAAQVETKGGKQHPMLYTRLDDKGAGFEPERDLITHGYGLDGGGSVAADEAGNVYVAWHGNPAGNTKGEQGRAVFLARSSDGGATFAREEIVSPDGQGSCACCGMKIIAGPGNMVAVLYRDAATLEERAASLLFSSDQGRTFKRAHSEVWRINTCPMSSAFLMVSEDKLIAGWETAGKARFAAFDASSGDLLKEVTPDGQRKARFPVAARSSKGDGLLVWTENVAWMKGGNVAWQGLDGDGEPTAEKGNVPGAPVWSFAAVYATNDGDFIVLY